MRIIQRKRGAISTPKFGVGSVKTEQGFTLIELLVVISIIGLLASVALVALQNARSSSRDAKKVSDMNQLAKGLELYFNTCRSYPVLSASSTINSTQRIYTGSLADCGNNQGTANSGGLGTTPSGIMTVLKMPTAPTPIDAACTGVNDYIYRSYDDVTLTTGSAAGDNIAGGYTIRFCLANAVGSRNGLSGGLHILTPSGFR